MTTKRVAYPCKIKMGGFSCERIFTLTLANGESYKSVASYLHFWNSENERLNKYEPSEGTIDGLVAGMLLKKDKSGFALIEIPDEEIIAVPTSGLISRPQEVDTNVPV